jgi:two-component system phosphate regulon response regulator PhoB
MGKTILPQKILVTDDNAQLRKMLVRFLQNVDYNVVSCSSGAQALALASIEKPDLVLLDVVIGKPDGMEVCNLLKRQALTRNVPVILISGDRMEDSDMVKGLDSGADDYLLKPIKESILAAKVASVLRRFRAPQELRDVLEQYGLRLDVSARKVALEGQEVKLTRKEFDLLTVLLRECGKVVTPRSLLETVFGYDAEVYTDIHTVEVHISRLRKKLGPKFSTHIKNIMGSGYRFD